ncbi:hypothetical protein ACFZBU_39765 [Embleya sp. NPDC008237]|uniref:hypothetical protein n=1 Tax=Embleya sp. NPDC008237 TaxID=3363978 RepID=UPI0036E67326
MKIKPSIEWTEQQRDAEIEGLEASAKASLRQRDEARRGADDDRNDECRRRNHEAAQYYDREYTEYRRLADGLKAGKSPADLGYAS